MRPTQRYARSATRINTGKLRNIQSTPKDLLHDSFFHFRAFRVFRSFYPVKFPSGTSGANFTGACPCTSICILLSLLFDLSTFRPVLIGPAAAKLERRCVRCPHSWTLRPFDFSTYSLWVPVALTLRPFDLSPWVRLGAFLKGLKMIKSIL